MAAEKMLKFVTVARDMPEKRPPRLRAKDFDEIYAEYAIGKAEEQAARCSQCGVPYCQTHCPLHNNIPDWLRMTAAGRLCEGNCVIEQAGHGTVTIGSVEKFITDTAWDQGWVRPIRPAAERTESVGIIGAGPAGLAAADMLRRQGVQVTVYDRHDRAGGLMTYGIPGFKLEKPVVMRRIDQLAAGGVEFVLNCAVGSDITFDAIRGKHDAVLVATGVYRSRELEIAGGDLAGVVRAIDYLTASNRVGFGDDVPEFDSGEMNAAGKRVVVIGGGDTAMDCVRTAVRQGAKSVRCLYRRDRANMPGSQREVANAEEEGVEFVWLTAPRSFEGDAAVSGVVVQKMRLGAPDATGRRMPELIEGADYTEDADLVVKALGFEPEDLPRLWGVPGLEVTRWGTVRAEFTTGRTALEGVFAAGDIVRGASLVVWAIRDGRDAAAAILTYLGQAAQSVAAE
jgi:glutamate synthase (NADPH/NADH) small chain